MGIARGTLLNLVGLGAPLPLAVFVVPSLLDALGTDTFALLTLLWVLNAYTSVFDLGLGRTLTQKLSTVLVAGNESASAGALCSTALVLVASLSVVLALCLCMTAPWLVSLLKLQADQSDAIQAVTWMAISLPAALIGTHGRGALEALHAFGRVNLVRLPLGLWSLLGPWFAVQMEAGLVGAAVALACGRMLAGMAWMGLAWHALPVWRQHPHPSRRWVRPLLLTGGWLTIGNLVGPLMGYADRFLVAGLLSVTAAAYYATPQELVSKLWVLPGALMSVMFPAFAQRLAENAPDLPRICADSLVWIVLLSLPLTLGLSLSAPELLSFWLGHEFSVTASPVLQWMSIGMFVGCIAQLPFTLLQSADCAKHTAVLHMLQLPLFVAAMVWVIPSAGVAGAAAVWALRNGIDMVCLFLICRWRFGNIKLWPKEIFFVIFAIATFGFLGSIIEALSIRVFWWFLAMALFLLLFSRSFKSRLSKN